jgi:hypothetical protein
MLFIDIALSSVFFSAQPSDGIVDWVYLEQAADQRAG